MKLKKILIGIFFILSAFIILCLGLVFKNRFDLRIAKNSDNQEIIDFEDQKNIEENTISTDDNTENVQQEQQEQTIIEEHQETPSTETTLQEVAQSKASSNAQSKKTTSDTTSQTTKQETKSQTQIKQETIMPTMTATQEIAKPKEEKKETTVPVVPETKEVVKNEEKYIRNDTMINKIKSVIENNPSEYMKTYGYNIVVDSSIKANANQFTFTETRVKAYIEYCFGTIRIYAEDYYKNGQLIMTECYLY